MMLFLGPLGTKPLKAGSKPRMLLHLRDICSKLWINLKTPLHKMKAIIRHALPVRLTDDYSTGSFVLFRREGGRTSDQERKQYTHGPNLCGRCLIWLTLNNLWRCVCSGTVEGLIKRPFFIWANRDNASKIDKLYLNCKKISHKE